MFNSDRQKKETIHFKKKYIHFINYGCFYFNIVSLSVFKIERKKIKKLKISKYFEKFFRALSFKDKSSLL